MINPHKLWPDLKKYHTRFLQLQLFVVADFYVFNLKKKKKKKKKKYAT